ncbi:hypothetical protein DHODJN_25755 [Methylorubrum extorquens]
MRPERRGRTYGTIIADIERRPIDLLPDRSAGLVCPTRNKSNCQPPSQVSASYIRFRCDVID